MSSGRFEFSDRVFGSLLDSESVGHQADFHAFFHFLGEDIHQIVAVFVVAYDVIFNENRFFRGTEGFEQGKPLRDVRFVTGTLDEIIARGKDDPNKDDFIGAVIEGNAINPMAQIREVYPNVLSVDFAKSGQTESGEIAIEVDLENLDVMEQFEKFFRSKTGEGLTDSQKKLIQQLFEENGVVL